MRALTANQLRVDGVRFPSLWLRDNCLCAECRDPGTAPVPTLQLPHCLINAAEGGETGLVDGFQVAAQLRAQDPVSFDVLTRTPCAIRFPRL
jgi:hypothetical protein